MRHAFIVAYDGSRYFGFVRQSGRQTIEGELLKAFKKCGLYRELGDAKYRVAARTDRGASALGQVVALDLLKKPDIQALNSHLPEDIKILSACEVNSDFDPRRDARSKHYRYKCELPPNFDLKSTRRAAKMFEGVHDFKNFCKRERGRTTVGEIKSVRITARDGLTFDFVAPSFLWQQVRRIVKALLAVGAGEISLPELELRLDGKVDKGMQPAPAGGLVLIAVDYPSPSFKFKGHESFVGYR